MRYHQAAIPEGSVLMTEIDADTIIGLVMGLFAYTHVAINHTRLDGFKSFLLFRAKPFLHMDIPDSLQKKISDHKQENKSASMAMIRVRAFYHSTLWAARMLSAILTRQETYMTSCHRHLTEYS